MTWPPFPATTDQAAQSELTSVMARLGFSAGGLNLITQIQLAVANLLTESPPVSGWGIYNIMDPAFGAKGDGVTDDAAAIQAAVANDGIVFIPNRPFVVKSSITLTGVRPLILVGTGPKSRIINRAAADTPTFLIDGAQYWEFRDFAVLGDASYPNEALYTRADSNGTRPCYWRLQNLFLCPNGVGVHLQDVNTAVIEDCKYWPSGYNGGATATASLLTHAILADGSTTVNDVHIRTLNAVNYTTIANGGSAIKFAAAAGCGGVTIADCEIEGTDATQYRSLDLANLTAGIAIRDNFVENSEVTIDNCVGVVLRNTDGGNTAVYTVTNSDMVDVVGTNGTSFSADSTNVTVAVARSTFSGADGYVNDATKAYTSGVYTTGSVQVPERQANLNYVYACRVTDQSMAAGRTVVLFASNISDPFSQYVAGTGTFTAKYAGLYRIVFVCTIITSTDGQFFQVELWKNGSLLPSYGSAPGPGTQTGAMVEAVVTLAVGDTIQAQVYNSDASAHNLNPASLSIVQL